MSEIYEQWFCEVWELIYSSPEYSPYLTKKQTKETRLPWVYIDIFTHTILNFLLTSYTLPSYFLSPFRLRPLQPIILRNPYTFAKTAKTSPNPSFRRAQRIHPS